MAAEFESLQEAAQELGDNISTHDKAGLEALSTAHLREQADARDELYDFVDGLWEKTKADVPDAGARDECAGLAGLRELAEVLRSNAHEILDGRDG
ncbi:hypothetical protein [Streptomyces sp. NRRL S-1868]|uniref:hypothetical protein n=1 Tax=Streptomyces sp. NRRL S-1868 TaxID=1463892 RepID=UPI0004C84D1E|nr:hypothetical protein [Streptomyces sp. NRRL S-1868]